MFSSISLDILYVTSGKWVSEEDWERPVKPLLLNSASLCSLDSIFSLAAGRCLSSASGETSPLDDDYGAWGAS